MPDKKKAGSLARRRAPPNKKQKTFEVWIFPDTIRILREWKQAWIYLRRDHYRSRIRATLTLSPPRKKKATR